MNKYIKMFMDDNNLKVGEKFKQKDGNKIYHFDENGFLMGEEGYRLDANDIASFLYEYYEVEKLSSIPTERFIPEEKEEYWFVDRYGNVDFGTYHKAGRHDYIIAHTLIFKTKEQAKDYKWFLDKVDEYKKPFEYEDDNYCLYYNHENESVCLNNVMVTQGQGVIHFGNEDNIDAFIKEVGEERIKKYMFDIWK